VDYSPFDNKSLEKAEISPVSIGGLQNHNPENPRYRRLAIVTVWLANLEEHPVEAGVSTSQGQNAYPSTRPGRCNAPWSCVWEAPGCHVELSRKESCLADV